MLKAEKKDGFLAGDQKHNYLVYEIFVTGVKKNMATTLEIINGISQAVSRGFDGALDDETREPITIGLRREEGRPLIDERVMVAIIVSPR